LGVTEGIGITNQKDLIKNIIQECDCPFFFFEAIAAHASGPQTDI
jgi:hypothetical protein